MLMAAGLGTRMRPFTSRVPKPFLPVMGVPVLQFAVDTLAEAGISEVIVNIHHLPTVARNELDKIDFGRMKVVVSDESALLLGSAGGLKKAEKHFQSEPFIYMNGDVLNGLSVRHLIEKHFSLGFSDLTLCIQEKSPSGEKYRRMILSEDRQRLMGFGSTTEEGVSFFSGAAVIHPRLLSGLKEEPCDFVPMILNESLVNAGRVGVYSSSSRWIDVGHPKGWRDAHFTIMKDLADARAPHSWKNRIEKSSFRVNDSIWCRKGSSVPKKTAENVYLDSQSPLDEVCANTVLYGLTDEKKLGPNLIYWNGLSAS